MSFSYDLNTGADLDKVRFYTTDTDANAPIHPDEELLGLITLTGSWQKATVAAFRSIIGKIAKSGKVELDWLKVDAISGLKFYRDLMADFQTDHADDLGITIEHSYEAGAVFPTRYDTESEESGL